MVANKRYQIFVSSTQADLRDEREAIINALTKIGYIAVGMEQFPATDEEQMDFIRPVIDDSDYYIIVVKGRYGSLGTDGVSYTEKEFRYAVQQKKPAMAFLYKDITQLLVSDTDNDHVKFGKLKTFRDELESKRIVKHWLSKEELIAQVKDSVNDMVRRKPAIGWIRGDQALDPEVYRERDRLKRDIEDLKKFHECGEVYFPDNLAHGNDIIAIKYQRELVRSRSGKKETLQSDAGEFKVTCNDIINLITDKLYDRASEAEIRNVIYQFVSDACSKKAPREAPKIDSGGELVGYENKIAVDGNIINSLRFHFEALGLINAITESYEMVPGYTAQRIIWHLTEKGRKYISRMNAITEFARQSGNKATSQ